MEKNESLKGLDYLDAIYQAIVNKQVLNINYRSFKARSANTFLFYPYLLNNEVELDIDVYEPEVYSGYRIFDDSFMNLRHSSSFIPTSSF